MSLRLVLSLVYLQVTKSTTWIRNMIDRFLNILRICCCEHLLFCLLTYTLVWLPCCSGKLIVDCATLSPERMIQQAEQIAARYVCACIVLICCF